jgi:hypothetical protein
MITMKNLLKDLDKREGNADYWKSEAEKWKEYSKCQYLEQEATYHIIHQLYNSGKISRDALESFLDMLKQERYNIRRNLMQ